MYRRSEFALVFKISQEMLDDDLYSARMLMYKDNVACIYCQHGVMQMDFVTAIYTCASCKQQVTRESLEDLPNVTIIRGAFSQLLQPGLKRTLLTQYLTYPGTVWFKDQPKSVMEQGLEDELMGVLYPDTSKLPKWRQPARQHEAPIKAFRCWHVRQLARTADVPSNWVLTSAAISTIWEGPVIKADYPPLDPRVWDKARREGRRDVRDLTAQVFNCAGIHALKTLLQAEDAADAYNASCYGEVDLWGRVVQFQLGYRAEYCMIKKLYLMSSLITLDDRQVKEIVKNLADRYQCDVEVVA